MARRKGREPAAHSVARALAADIITGRYAAGAQLLAESDLAAKLGVGRSTVREAAKILFSKGLLAAAPRRGTVVRPPSQWHHLDPDLLDLRLLQPDERDNFLRHMREIRIMFEPFAAELAALRRTDADVTALYRALADMRDARPESPTAVDADIAFHAAIAAASQNPLLRHLASTLEPALRHAFSDVGELGLQQAYSANLELHQQIADSIARQDARKASDVCRRLIARSGKDRAGLRPRANRARGSAA